MSGEATVTPDPLVPAKDPVVGPLGNRFFVVAVAARRVLQIRDGSRPRLDPGGHKPCVVAVAEVVAGTVPCYV